MTKRFIFMAIAMATTISLAGGGCDNSDEEDSPCLGDSLCTGTVWNTAPEDLRPAEAIVIDYLTQTLSGTIVETAHTQDSSEFVPCRFAGKTFSIEIYPVGEMDCFSDECSLAEKGRILFNLSLEIEEKIFEFKNFNILIHDLEVWESQFSSSTIANNLDGSPNVYIQEWHGDEGIFTPSTPLGPFEFFFEGDGVSPPETCHLNLD